MTWHLILVPKDPRKLAFVQAVPIPSNKCDKLPDYNSSSQKVNVISYLTRTHLFCILCLSFRRFDEVYYGQFVSLYMKQVFFVDESGPPFGHMILALGGRHDTTLPPHQLHLSSVQLARSLMHNTQSH